MILAVTMNPAIDIIYFVNHYNLGEVHRPNQVIVSPGGKGLNVARVASLMGEKVVASGLLGGSNGAVIREKIKELGLIDGFSEIQGETRICINVTDPLAGTCTEVLEPGPEITELEMERFLTVFAHWVTQVDVITLSGSLPLGAPIDCYNRLILLAKKAGKKVFLDTSGPAFVRGIEAKPSLIKPNEDEIKSIYEGPLTTLNGLIDAILHLRQKGLEWPVITRGKEGAIVGLSDGVYQVTIPSVKTINAVGSGDAFLAGCATAYARGYCELDMIRMGAACGTVNTLYRQTGFVEKELVKQYFSIITIQKVASY